MNTPRVNCILPKICGLGGGALTGLLVGASFVAWETNFYSALVGTLVGVLLGAFFSVWGMGAGLATVGWMVLTAFAPISPAWWIWLPGIFGIFCESFTRTLWTATNNPLFKSRISMEVHTLRELGQIQRLEYISVILVALVFIGLLGVSTISTFLLLRVLALIVIVSGVFLLGLWIATRGIK